jgi:hypothetical protein
VDLYIHSPIRLHGVVLNYLSIGTALRFTLISVSTINSFRLPETILRFISHYCQNKRKCLVSGEFCLIQFPLYAGFGPTVEGKTIYNCRGYNSFALDFLSTRELYT